MYVMAKGLVYQIIDRNCSKTIEIENRSGAKTRRHKVMKDSSLFANIFGRAREKMPTRVGVSKILSFWQTTYHDFVFQLCARPMVTQLKQVRSVFVSKKLVGQNGFSGEICGTLSCKLACVQTK